MHPGCQETGRAYWLHTKKGPRPSPRSNAKAPSSQINKGQMTSWVSGSIGVRQVLSYQELWYWPLSTCQVPESSWLSEKAVKLPPVIHPLTCPCHDPVILEPLTKSSYAQKICVSILRVSAAPSSLCPVVRRKMLHQQAPGFVQLL